MANELELIPPLKEGEVLLISRSLGDKNVVMVVTLTGDGFDHLSKNEISLTARMDTWGATSHADAQIARQKESIDRLLKHLQAHCMDNTCQYRDLPPGQCIRTDPHEAHTWFRRTSLGTPGIGPGSTQYKEEPTHCPGHNPSV